MVMADMAAVEAVALQIGRVTLQFERIARARRKKQFERLMKDRDPNSSTEEAFLKFLYQKGLRLPDEAQKSVPGIYVCPDFFYAPDTWIFCDGTPHDEPQVQEKDKIQRKALTDRGDEVIVYHYKDDLATLVAGYPDIFKKVR